MNITDLSILCKWDTLKNRQCIKYLFAPPYVCIYRYRRERDAHIHTHTYIYIHIYIYIYTHTHTHICVCACTHVVRIVGTLGKYDQRRL